MAARPSEPPQQQKKDVCEDFPDVIVVPQVYIDDLMQLAISRLCVESKNKINVIRVKDLAVDSGDVYKSVLYIRGGVLHVHDPCPIPFKTSYNLNSDDSKKNICHWIVQTFGLRENQRYNRLVEVFSKHKYDNASMTFRDWRLWWAIVNGRLPVERLDSPAGFKSNAMQWVLTTDQSLDDIEKQYGRFKNMDELKEWQQVLHSDREKLVQSWQQDMYEIVRSEYVITQ